MVSKDRPVGAVEIAELLGVKRATVDQWQQRDLLPTAEWTVGGRPAWRASNILRWAEATGRSTSLEQTVRELLDQLESPRVALTRAMKSAVVEASELVERSPNRALARLSRECEAERTRHRRAGRDRELRYVERVQRELTRALSGFHALSQ